MRTVPMPWSVSRTVTKSPGNDDGGAALKYSGDFCLWRPDGSGQTKLSDQIIKLDLVDAMIQGQTRPSLMSKVSKLSARLVRLAALVRVCLPLTQ